MRAVEAIELLPANEFLVPAAGIAEIRARLGRLADRLPERLAADLARLEGVGEPAPPAAAAASRGDAPPAPGARALDVGDAAEVWSAVVCPSSGLDHLGPDTLLLIDEPGEVAAAAEFLWEQAAERRRDLVGAGELPREWPSAYVEPGPGRPASSAPAPSS